MYEVKYNKSMNRWEVFRHGRNVIRNGELQPVFVGTETACVKAAQVDGEKLKPDTYYKIQNGEFTEVNNG